MKTSIISILFVFVLVTYGRAQMKEEFRAVKITNVDSDILFSDATIAAGMDYLASIGINTILVVVWNGSRASGDFTLYPSAVMERLFGIPIHPSFQGRDPLKRVIIEAHRNGMEVLPWFEMGFATSYSQEGGHILETFPEWALKDREGNLVVKNGFDWMSAINPEVQELILSLTLEVVDQYDVDGVEYSDRIPAMPVEGGYDSVTVSIYRDEHAGLQPPYDFRDENWKRWRADKLTAFYKRVRDSVKARGAHLIVSSSPSLYPWSYEEYLQDSKTWMEEGIADNIIPQVYRKNYPEYIFELNKSLQNFPGLWDRYYAGMLIKSGSYTIEPTFFLDAIAANRSKNVNGEAFFFYEGLRDNQDALGDTLKATFYAEQALVPERNGRVWRPRPDIVNEDAEGTERSDGWIPYDNIKGFEGGCFYAGGSTEEYIVYNVDIPVSAWYDLYVYGIRHWNASQRAEFVLFTKTAAETVWVDQTADKHSGWYKLGESYLRAGEKKKLLQLSNQADREHLLFADAVMPMINRKKSPDVEITDMGLIKEKMHTGPHTASLLPNYPNPFNPVTTIRYQILGGKDRVETPYRASQLVQLTIHNILGQKVATLVSENQLPGEYSVRWNASGLSCGIYFYRLTVKDQRHGKAVGSLTGKMMLLK